MNWYDDHRNLAALWMWMCDCHDEPADGPGYFMEKPWKWEEEWKRYLSARLAGAKYSYDPPDLPHEWITDPVRPQA